MIIIIDKIVSALDNGDFSKAFDTVDHTILLKQIYILGIRGLAGLGNNLYLSTV